MPKLFTAKWIVAFTGLFIVAYILWIGPERFYFESLGTLILSPIIYPRLLPPPLNGWLLTALVHFPLLAHILCTIPLALLGFAFLSAIYSLARNSLPFALASWLIVGGVISFYHHVQPMGITLIRY